MPDRSRGTSLSVAAFLVFLVVIFAISSMNPGRPAPSSRPTPTVSSSGAHDLAEAGTDVGSPTGEDVFSNEEIEATTKWTDFSVETSPPKRSAIEAASPRETSRRSDSSAKRSEGPAQTEAARSTSPPQQALGEPKICPETMEQSPDDYDRCYAGYLPPRIEWAGYTSCKRFVDPKFGEVVRVVGRIQLVGGNFRASDWGAFSELQGEGRYRTVSSLNISPPYVLIWNDYIRISSMDEAYLSWIDTVGNDGRELIDQSLMDPTCIQR